MMIIFIKACTHISLYFLCFSLVQVSLVTKILLATSIVDCHSLVYVLLFLRLLLCTLNSDVTGKSGLLNTWVNDVTIWCRLSHCSVTIDIAGAQPVFWISTTPPPSLISRKIPVVPQIQNVPDTKTKIPKPLNLETKLLKVTLCLTSVVQKLA